MTDEIGQKFLRLGRRKNGGLVTGATRESDQVRDVLVNELPTLRLRKRCAVGGIDVYDGCHAQTGGMAIVRSFCDTSFIKGVFPKPGMR